MAKCKSGKGLFPVVSHKFKLCHNIIIVLSLQNFELKRKSHESSQEWMDRWQTKAADCDYNKYDKRLTKQFTHWLDDEGICKI